MNINLKSTEWKSMGREDIDSNRMKAYLSFDEQEEGPNVDTDIVYYYINKKGDTVNCNSIYVRDNGEVVVVNENGCQVVLDKSELFIEKD
jgi:hypothetical protein